MKLGDAPLGSEELALVREGLLPIGVDEVGRGCWAGEVMAAAVALRPGALDQLDKKLLRLIRDSKTLSAEQRAMVARELPSWAMAHAVAAATVAEIDEVGIGVASQWAMVRALRSVASTLLQEQPAARMAILVDGNRPLEASLLSGTGLDQHLQFAIVRGDGRCRCIAAASILAKVARDIAMSQASGTYPGYGFERHVGYGTKEHQQALNTLGPSAIHRHSFAPVRQVQERMAATVGPTS